MSQFTILVVGDGMIGRALGNRAITYQRPRQGVRLIRTSRRDVANDIGYVRLELADDPARWEIPERVDLAFLTAAMTSIEACERDHRQARLINVERMALLADRLVARGAHVVFTSSAAVFDGSLACPTPAEPGCPNTAYGYSKLLAELDLLAIGGCTVLRLSKVIGPATPTITKWLVDFAAGADVEAFADRRIAPVSLDHAVEALWRLGLERPGGVHQLSATDEISYADTARYLSLGRGRVIEVKAPPSIRQGQTLLDASSLARTAGIGAVPARAALGDLLHPRRAAA